MSKLREPWALMQMGARLRCSRGELLEYQNQRLRLMVAHAYRNVAHYRRLFDKAGLSPDDIRTVDDLPLIPLTTKDDLRLLPPEDLIARNIKPDQLIIRMSGGSTGEPKRIRRTWMEERLLSAFRFRARHILGLRATDHIASVGMAYEPQAADHQGMSSLLHKMGLFRATKVYCAQPAAQLVRRLEQIQPDVITGNASSVAQAAIAVIERGGTTVRPRFVTTGAETQTPLMRRQIATAFQSPIYNFYGCNEFNVVAWECPMTGMMHTCDDAVIVEVLRGNRPVGVGEPGEVVGTALHSFAMPLIRYQLDDAVCRGPDRCGCGLPFGSIHTVRGRMVDYFPLPNGRLLHPYEIYEHVLHDRDEWARQIQLIQERRDFVRMRVVTLVMPSQKRLTEIQAHAQRLMGQETTFHIDFVPQIDREPNGKFRVARSLVHSAYDTLDQDSMHDAC